MHIDIHNYRGRLMRFVVWITTWMIHISYWYDGLALLKWVEYSLGKGGSAAQISVVLRINFCQLACLDITVNFRNNIWHNTVHRLFLKFIQQHRGCWEKQIYIPVSIWFFFCLTAPTCWRLHVVFCINLYANRMPCSYHNFQLPVPDILSCASFIFKNYTQPRCVSWKK